MPPEVFLFGEDRMCAAFAARPPDWMVVINRPAMEYGYRFLGDDYGRRLLDWVEANYRVVDRVQEEQPDGSATPFAAILRREGPAPAPGDTMTDPADPEKGQR
jgi:hypothetical protein